MTDALTQPAAPPVSPDRVGRILAAAADYRVAECDRLAAEARVQLPPVTLVRDVYGPVLREAGDRWHRGQLSVVQEHLLSSTIRRQLYYALDGYNQATDPGRPPVFAFSTLSGERHELGSLMLAVIAASRGFGTVYLGPDLPAAEVGRFCARVSVQVVALSIVTHPAVIDVAAQLAELRRVLPAHVTLWIGGQAALLLAPNHLPANSHLVRDLAEFAALLDALEAGAATHRSLS